MAFLNNIANRVGTTVNSTLGQGINSILGADFPAEDIPLYDKFLYNILSDSDNAVTEESTWVVFFSNNPDAPDALAGGSTKPSLTQMLKGIGSNIVDSATQPLGIGSVAGSKKDFGVDVAPWQMGDKTSGAYDQFFNNMENAIMLVQGINIPGDGFSVSRPSNSNVGGFLKPMITGVRNDVPEMDLTFLENNNSITDFVLRPWVIHSSYSSLKFAKRATITCYNLTRSPSGFRVRKKFTFYNAVPMSIDSEQYTYVADSSYVTRQTKFAFTHYTLDDGTSMKDSLLGAVGNYALQVTRNYATTLVETGVEVVGGAANQVYTNIKGAFVDSVNDHLVNVQSRLREYGKQAEDSIIDPSQRAIDKAIGYSPDKDSIMRGGEDFPTSGTDTNPSPRKVVEIGADDSRKQSPIPPKSSGVVNGATYTIAKINQDDTPDTSSLNTQEVTISS